MTCKQSPTRNGAAPMQTSPGAGAVLQAPGGRELVEPRKEGAREGPQRLVRKDFGLDSEVRTTEGF